MQQPTRSIIISIIDVMKAMYKSQGLEVSKRLKNIDYINLDTLTAKVEKELTTEEITKNTQKIISIIESIIQD